MSRLGEGLEHRLKRSGLLVVAGLLVVLATLLWNHALAFVAFSSLGVVAMGAGMLLYLLAVATYGFRGEDQEE